MENWSHVAFSVVIGFILVSLCDSRSVGLETLTRSSKPWYAYSCPPPDYDPFGDEACPEFKREETCRYDDECEPKLCCFNGCENVCRDSIRPPPIIDWPLSHRAPKDPLDGGVIELLAPHVKEGGCMFKGVSHNEGEIFSSGCRKCECLHGEVTCDVMGCFPQDLVTVGKEVEGNAEHSGNGPQEGSEVPRDNDDSEDDGDENREKKEDTEREEKQFKLLEAKSVGENVDDWWSEQ